jgi:hypothetical protein
MRYRTFCLCLFLLLTTLLLALTACSDSSRLFWGQVLTQTGDNLLYAPRTYCTTTMIGRSAYTSCSTY